MTRPTFVTHQGTSVLVIDYSHARGASLRELVADAGSAIRKHPEKSLRILARMEDLEFTPESTQLLLEHIRANEPFSRATAVVGLGHLSKVIPVANRLTGRNLKAFDDERDALDWLVSMAEAEEAPDDDKIHFIDHGGERILSIDFRGATGEDLEERVSKAASIIRSQPPLSVLTLTLLHGLAYSEQTTALMKDYVRGNRPHVLASAVVGLDYLRRIILPLNRLTGRKLRAFDDIDRAKEWLVEEKNRMLGI